jgi:hypothetical protein
MTASNTTTAKRPDVVDRPRAVAQTDIDGDPGVGGLLADPEEAVTKVAHRRKIAANTPSPDPEPPEAHGDWPPNRAWRG